MDCIVKVDDGSSTIAASDEDTSICGNCDSNDAAGVMSCNSCDSGVNGDGVGTATASASTDDT